MKNEQNKKMNACGLIKSSEKRFNLFESFWSNKRPLC